MSVPDPRTDLNARRASFLAEAEDYERYRPGYPDAAIAWLVGTSPQRVIDVGCGPGNLTTQLALLGHDVVGLDPSEAMLRAARKKALRAVRGAAEALPFADACADVVTAATAFHWFDHELAVPEIRRVLRPSGRVGLLTNIRDESVPWVEALSKIIGSESAMAATLGGAEGMPLEFTTRLEARGHFHGTQHRVFEYEQLLTVEGLLGLVKSRSYIRLLPDDEREGLVDEVRDLCRAHPDLGDPSGLVMPYTTHVLRSRAA